MISINEYKENPCRAFSIPYWKAKGISIPKGMKIIHGSEIDEKLLKKYADKRFFRLKHDLKNIPQFETDEIAFEMISPDRIGELTEMINRSYTHSDVHVTVEHIQSLTKTKVYCPELWIGAFTDGKLIGSILCDFDSEVGEAIIEWLQVLPEYRGKGIASALTCMALRKMGAFAEFATVSGECDNITAPERVYRRCGFKGNDVWHILNKK